MATVEYDVDSAIKRLGKLGRPMIRQIVEAGAGAAEKLMAESVRTRNHIRTGDMLESIGTNEYLEILGGGRVDVYPQGNDREGVRNATKAYVINYGRGGTRKRGKMGDRFITGNEKRTEEAVHQAMQAEHDRLVDQINNN